MTHYTHTPDHALKLADTVNVEKLAASLASYEADLAAGKDAQAAPIIRLCSQKDDVAALQALAADIRARFKNVVICGAGGSGLSGKVLASLRLFAARPRVYTLDNIDPSAIEAVMEFCPPKDTLVIAISKSGSTAETLSQFYALLSHFKKSLPDVRDHFITITMAAPSPMRAAAEQYGFRTLEHPADIGGRFSLFTAVGLLPAALAGVDIEKIRAGAAATASRLGKGVHPARLGAALQYDAMQSGKNMSVMLPYCERLSGFSAWYRQSWAESLGKGGKGTTPISAVGTTDQHSQLQLYLDGPNDKFFTLILHARAGTGQPIDAPNLPGLEYLSGHTTGDLMAAEQKATLETLNQHGRPVRVIHIPELNEESLGALIMHFMLEIFFMARLLGVNAFDQPAVEEGKVLARDYLLEKKL